MLCSRSSAVAIEDNGFKAIVAVAVVAEDTLMMGAGSQPQRAESRPENRSDSDQWL